MLSRLSPKLAGLLPTAARAVPAAAPHVCGPTCRHSTSAAAAASPSPSCGHLPGHCTHRCNLSTHSQSGGNRGVTYVKPGVVEVRDLAYPKLELQDQRRKCQHGVILKVVATNICGSDQHMVRGRTSAPSGLVLGHEITGEIVEAGSDVLYLKKGDVVSIPFNIACGRCPNCKAGLTGICLNVNPERPGSAYGYVSMGGWIGGQSEYVMVPYADFNALKLGRDREAAMAKMRDLSLLSDIFPTGACARARACVRAEFAWRTPPAAIVTAVATP